MAPAKKTKPAKLAPPLAAAFAAGQASSKKRHADEVAEDADDVLDELPPKRQQVTHGPGPAVEPAPIAPTVPEQQTLPEDGQVAEQPADVRQAATEPLPRTPTPEEPAADAGTAAAEEPVVLADASQADAEPAAEIEATELPGTPDQGTVADAGAAAIVGPPATLLREVEPVTTRNL